jgi:hypothetical protein
MKLNYNKQEVAHAIETKLRSKPRSKTENNVWYILDGKKVLRVTYPHGRGVLPHGTANNIISQLKLDKSQFKELVKCPLSGSDYEKIIRSLGII